MSKPTLESIASMEGVITAAFKSDAMKIKPRSKIRPTIDTASKAVIEEVKKRVISKVTKDVVDLLTDDYEGHVLLDGEYEDAERKDEWESAVDDMVENKIEAYTPYLSQDWLGRKTIGVGLHLPDGINKFAESLALEYYKQLTYNLTPPQILSSAGIVTADIEAALEVHINPTKEEIETMSNEQELAMQSIVERLQAHLGKDFDMLLVYDDLDQISDDDDNLSNGAMTRLGLMADDISTLRNERLFNGTDFIEPLIKQLEAGSKKAPAKKAATPAKKTETPKTAAPTGGDRISADAIEAGILVELKDCGFVDKDISAQLGIARATYNNHVNGKTTFTPTETQRAVLRDEVVTRINKLHVALGAIDGTEPEVTL